MTRSGLLCSSLSTAVATFLLAPSVFAEAGPVIPLPAADAKALELLGDGVVGKAIPAPPLNDLLDWYMGAPGGGEWTYHVLKGEKKEIRVESIKSASERNGPKLILLSL